ncbi:Glycosyltransferase involved in cell wall bisynthesis [Desulfonatronum thiosulfatophilum]|uniref:Glycosyltransferase involved in cell wall bisynthesis n=1 Tax=Desulfonatronum thiosulfatophilum TaxID=617002 RepID=A0A1G6D541_9BACT|nr:glycosyltransferase family 2 protein [Desulfonatronum thiosulfatophilum]SDB40294.1 Glycosyltransferase involved in cell wall bisynthesis [Desulfonatronum thiosulfatophilum]
MKLVMTLLCRNEEDVVEANIAFHLHQGVDFVIATDNASVDGTTAILEKFQRQGRLHLIHESEHNHDQAVWVTRMARLAAVEYGADWVIENDADEFWVPAEGSLRHSLTSVPKGIDVLRVPRVNFLPRPNSHHLPFYERMTVRERVSRNRRGRPLPPKICHRAYPDVSVGDGNHKATRSGGLMPTTDQHPLEILHFPMRSYPQFLNKIRQGVEAAERNARLTPDICGNWRFLYREYYLRGRLFDYYQEHVLDDQAVAEGIREGRLVADERLLEWMREIDACQSDPL